MRVIRAVVDEAEEGVGGAMDRDVNLRLRAGDAQELGAGEMVRVRALLRDPPPPDRPGGRDLQREAFFDRLGGQGYALGDVSVIAPATGGWSWERGCRRCPDRPSAPCGRNRR